MSFNNRDNNKTTRIIDNYSSSSSSSSEEEEEEEEKQENEISEKGVIVPSLTSLVSKAIGDNTSRSNNNSVQHNDDSNSDNDSDNDIDIVPLPLLFDNTKIEGEGEEFNFIINAFETLDIIEGKNNVLDSKQNNNRSQENQQTKQKEESTNRISNTTVDNESFLSSLPPIEEDWYNSDEIEFLRPQDYNTIFDPELTTEDSQKEQKQGKIIESQLQSAFDKMSFHHQQQQEQQEEERVGEIRGDVVEKEDDLMIFCLPCYDNEVNEEDDLYRLPRYDDEYLAYPEYHDEDNKTNYNIRNNTEHTPRGKPQMYLEQNKESLSQAGTLDHDYIRDEEVFKIADPIIKSFQQKQNERQCFGHKESIFGLSISPCGTYCASASQDSTVCIWDIEKNSLITTLRGHDKESECLRVAWASTSWGSNNESSILASGGADGIVKEWRRQRHSNNWNCVATLDHNTDNNQTHESETSKAKNDEANEKSEAPQIYAVQFIDEWGGLPSLQMDIPQDNISLSKSSILMTSSDDFIHIWQLATDTDDKMHFEKIMDVKFTHLEHGYGGVFVHLHIKDFDTNGSTPMTKYTQSTNIITDKKVFGGDRNPDNLVYVFDAQHSSKSNLLGVALSDGTLRLVNGRGVCVSLLELPGCQSHLTSFCWDMSGQRLATCVATGHVILWELHFGTSKDQVKPTCTAVLEGGHTERRPLYGASFCGGVDEVR